MFRKLTLLAGFGAGYVLGAKAGTERYEQIMAKARELAGQPAVQDLTTRATETATSVAGGAKAKANETVEKVASGSGGSASSSSSSSDVVDLTGSKTGAETGATPSAAPVAGAAASDTV